MKILFYINFGTNLVLLSSVEALLGRDHGGVVVRGVATGRGCEGRGREGVTRTAALCFVTMKMFGDVAADLLRCLFSELTFQHVLLQISQ